jgi:large subunit ribosomal protein L25
VPVILLGESADVKTGAGVLLQEINALRIRCLPQYLIAKIEVNIAAMKVDQAVHVRDLLVPAGVEIMNNPDEEVMRISRYVETKADAAAAAAAAEVAVIEKGKKDEKETAAKKK